MKKKTFFVIGLMMLLLLVGCGGDLEECDMDDDACWEALEGGDEFVDGLVASLSYLRDRVGVPRDMKLPAARQLRAHLNWAIGSILKAQGA